MALVKEYHLSLSFHAWKIHVEFEPEIRNQHSSTWSFRSLKPRSAKGLVLCQTQTCHLTTKKRRKRRWGGNVGKALFLKQVSTQFIPRPMRFFGHERFWIVFFCESRHQWCCEKQYVCQLLSSGCSIINNQPGPWSPSTCETLHTACDDGISYKSNILFEAPKWTLQKRYHAWYICGDVRYLTFAAKGWYVESRVFWHDELCFFKHLFGVLLRALFDPMSFLSYTVLADQANKGVTFQVAEALSWVSCVEFSKRIVSLGAGQIISGDGLNGQHVKQIAANP